jgi:hypothetical protein
MVCVGLTREDPLRLSISKLVPGHVRISAWNLCRVGLAVGKPPQDLR